MSHVLVSVVNFSNMKPATVTEIQTRDTESLSLGPKHCDILQAFRCWQNATFLAHNICAYSKLL